MKALQFLVKNPTSVNEALPFLKQQFPQYKVSLYRSPFGNFITVAKSALVGVSVTLLKGNSLIVIMGYTPSFIARVIHSLFGIFIQLFFMFSKRNSRDELAREIYETLIEKYG